MNKTDKCGSPAKVMLQYGKRNRVLVKDTMDVCCSQTHTRALCRSSKI